MADPRRIQRLESAILETLAPLVSHGLADPRVRLITITRIRLSPDLSIARVNWSCLGDERDRTKATHALEHARGRLQAEVAKALQTRTTPRLQFHYDESGEKAMRVTDILEQIRRERGDAPAEAGSAEPPPPPPTPEPAD